MYVMDHYIDDKIMTQIKEPYLKNDIKSLIKEKLNVDGFNEIWLYDKENIIRETKAIQDLCLEDIKYNNRSINPGGMLWIGKKEDGIVPGDIDHTKILTIANFCYDVPICLDYRNSEKNPIVVYLNSDIWIKIADSHIDFLNKIEFTPMS